MNDFDFNELERKINLVKQNNEASDRQVKVARLIITLNNIDSELANLENALINLTELKRKANQYSLVQQLETKLVKLADLRLKVQKAKLNLNFTFI